MSSLPPNNHHSHSGSGRFEKTQWTIILKARQQGGAGATDAMEIFARTYWPSIYRFIRRDGYNPHDAQDLTQGFYRHFLEKQLLNGVGERTGRFRNYLLTCLKHFLSDERDRADALKRGGGKTFISRDAMEAEERDAVEPCDWLTPAQIFERRWMQTVLETAQERLREKYEVKGKQALYAALKDSPLEGKTEGSYAEIGQRLGMTEQAVKSASQQLRERFLKELRREIARTVENPGEIDEEIRHLLGLLAT